MISTLLQGFMMGLAYAMPIGAQNIYVINSASRGTRKDAIKTALVFATMDISLGIACIIGVGQAIQSHAVVRDVLGAVGAGFLIFLGYKLTIKQANIETETNLSISGSLWKAAMLLTWCNPHALIDGSILLGSYQASLSIMETYIFACGLAIASATWFLSLTTFVNRFRSMFTTRTLACINRMCGVVMIGFGVKLALSLVGI